MKFRLGPSHVIAATMLAAIALFIVLTPLLPGYNPYGQGMMPMMSPLRSFDSMDATRLFGM